MACPVLPKGGAPRSVKQGREGAPPPGPYTLSNKRVHNLQTSCERLDIGLWSLTRLLCARALSLSLNFPHFLGRVRITLPMGRSKAIGSQPGAMADSGFAGGLLPPTRGQKREQTAGAEGH